MRYDKEGSFALETEEMLEEEEKKDLPAVVLHFIPRGTSYSRQRCCHLKDKAHHVPCTIAVA